MTTFNVIGQPADRVDGPQKVTGEAQYTADIQLPGTLWGKILRSPYPFAEIVSIDASEAKALPGVHAVLTGSDVQGVLYGRRLRDVPALAQDVVRFIGEPVAAVAAEVESRLGQAGTSTTPLNPGGKAMFDAALCNVITQGEMIAAGTPVKVIGHRGSDLLVIEA